MVIKKYSRTWKNSKSPTKQRKFARNAPLHVRGKFVHAHLSKELKKKHNRRSLQVKNGDKVKILRGQFSGKTGKISRVDLRKSAVYIEGIEMVKKDGNKIFYPIHASNLVITELLIDDKKRVKSIEKKVSKSEGQNNG